MSLCRASWCPTSTAARPARWPIWSAISSSKLCSTETIWWTNRAGVRRNATAANRRRRQCSGKCCTTICKRCALIEHFFFILLLRVVMFDFGYYCIYQTSIYFVRYIINKACSGNMYIYGLIKCSSWYEQVDFMAGFMPAMKLVDMFTHTRMWHCRSVLCEPSTWILIDVLCDS